MAAYVDPLVLRVQDGRDALLIVVFETPSIHHVKTPTGGLEPMPADIGRRQSTSRVTRRHADTGRTGVWDTLHAKLLQPGGVDVFE